MAAETAAGGRLLVAGRHADGAGAPPLYTLDVAD
jgi:hypothetical protein